MIAPPLSLQPQVPTPVVHGRERLIRAGAALWRVTDTNGSIRGHLRVIVDAVGVRYRAERLHRASGTFTLIGEFWCADDAVAALRY